MVVYRFVIVTKAFPKSFEYLWANRTKPYGQFIPDLHIPIRVPERLRAQTDGISSISKAIHLLYCAPE